MLPCTRRPSASQLSWGVGGGEGVGVLGGMGLCCPLSILNPQPHTQCDFSVICAPYVTGAPTAQSHLLS